MKCQPSNTKEINQWLESYGSEKINGETFVTQAFELVMGTMIRVFEARVNYAPMIMHEDKFE